MNLNYKYSYNYTHKHIIYTDVYLNGKRMIVQLRERLGIPLVRVKTLLKIRGVDLNSLLNFFPFLLIF